MFTERSYSGTPMTAKMLRLATRELNRWAKDCPPAHEALPPVPCSVTLYRLVMSHPDWPHETRTKWQESPDFTKALAKAKELGVTARVESQNDKILP